MSEDALAEQPDDALVQQYEKATTTASQVARQLAFAGIGIVWLFSAVKPDSTTLWNPPSTLRVAGLLLAVSLALDLIHAVYRAFAFGVLLWLAERSGVPPTPQLDLPAAVHRPSLLMFYGKLITLVGAYAVILWYLVHHLA